LLIFISEYYLAMPYPNPENQKKKFWEEVIHLLSI
jgi:hypothetical protein